MTTIKGRRIILGGQQSSVDLSSFPALPAVANAPAIAAPGSPFSVNAVGQLVDGVPETSHFTHNASYDEHFIMTGENCAGINFKAFNGQQLFDCIIPSEVDNSTVQTGLARIPASSDPYNTLVVWPGNSTGYGKPFVLNRTQVDYMWRKATAGMTIAVNGRNLATNNISGTSNSNIYIQRQDGGSVVSCTVTEVNKYHVEFTIPVDTSVGSYYCWCHNGHGGQYGWSERMTFDVISAQDHVLSRVWGATFTVNLNSDSSVDNAIAINQAALNAHNAGGGIVEILGSGYVATPFTYYDNLKYKGASDGSTTIIIKSGFDKGGNGLWGKDEPGIFMCMWEKININNFAEIAVCPYQDVFFRYRGSNMIWFKDCKINAPGFQVWQFNTGNNQFVWITGCEVVSKEYFVERPYQFFVKNNKLYGTYDSETPCQHFSCNEVEYSGNLIRDYNNKNGVHTPTDGELNSSYGWGKGRGFLDQGQTLSGASRNIYVANNRAEGMGTRPGASDQNKGECWLREGGLSKYAGAIVSATSSTFTIGGNLPNNVSDVIPNHAAWMIVQGRGMGQSGWVQNYAGGVITIEKPFNVIPDSTSVVQIGLFVINMVVYNNYHDCNGKDFIAQGTNNTANACVSFFGGCIDPIADKNDSYGARNAFLTWATQHSNDFLESTHFPFIAFNRAFHPREGFGDECTDEYYLRPKYTCILANMNRANEVYDPYISGTDVFYGVQRDALINANNPNIDCIVWEKSKTDMVLSHSNITNRQYEKLGSAPGSIPSGTVRNDVYYNNIQNT